MDLFSLNTIASNFQFLSSLSQPGGIENTIQYKFNAATELNESFDVDYYETYFREYDAQVGRFTGVDEMSEKSIDITPYNFVGDNPIALNDPMGLFRKMPDEDYTGAETTGRVYRDAAFDMDTSPDTWFNGGGGKYSGYWSDFLSEAFASQNGGYMGSDGSFVAFKSQ